MKKNLRMTAAFFNNDFYWLITQAIGMIAVGDSDVEPEYLASNVDDAKLGELLRQCLLSSRKIEMAEFQELFQSGAFNELDDVREKAAMQKYGYKTKRALYKNMDRCSVDLVDGKIKIQPMHHKSLDSYTVTKNGPEPLFLDASISDAELGAALREGFKRCTSAVSG